MVVFEDEELIPAVSRILSKVEPTLALDGGSVRLLCIKNAVVYVRLQGACAGCSHSHLTLKNLIEQKIKEQIHPEITVVNVPTDEDFARLGLNER